MQYDFTARIARRAFGSGKWESFPPQWEAAGAYPMDTADMEFKTAPCITQALVQAAGHGTYGYTALTPQYYNAVLQWMQTRHNWQVQKDWLLHANGVVSALYSAVRAFTQPGDAVLIHTPVYAPFISSIVGNNRKLVQSKMLCQNGLYTLDYDDTEEKIVAENVKLVILCSPQNPAGRVWTRDELLHLAHICLRHNVLLISDEIHFDFVHAPNTHTVLATLSEEIAQNCVIMTAPSKTFNLPGLHSANVFVPNEALRARMQKQLQTDGGHGMNFFAQVATIAAYTSGADWLEALLVQLQSNYALFVSFCGEHLPKAVVSPLQGTYLVWVNFGAYFNNEEDLSAAMQRAMCAVTAGSWFNEGFALHKRFNIALPQQALLGALQRLAQQIAR